ncbi:protein kinase domain-containing protein [Rubritalea sp.]|uniref:protein kinase domain-containing protein n=1 Tax=Rubritalea sp. TaxID=2109375 RepID=UPI003EF68A4F
MSDERYEIRGKIGQGGVGAVYRAYDTQLRREVAIKRVLADEGYEDSDLATRNLLKEATALSSVQHPHICTVYDAGMDKEGPYVVMELINGKTLDEMVERGTLTYDDFREVAIQSQEAMIAAQDLDLVHRDLKPSNVMVCWLPSGRFQVKLVDFGLAKFSAKPSLQTIDHGDAVFGSIFFMAPEQFERTPLDRRTDMYSLGAMYYYSLAGTYPFNGDSAPQVMASHLQNSVQPLNELRPDLPQWVCDWVMWHIARDMNDRPESARVALEKYLADEAAATQGGATASLRTGPQLIIPATSPQANQPAGTHGSVNAQTGPQSISPPGGRKTLTSAQPVRPASAVTGGTAVQPTRPQVTPNANINTGPASTTPATEAGDQTTPEAVSAPTVEGMSSSQKKIIIGSLAGAAVILVGILIFQNSSGKEAEQFNDLVGQVTDLTAKDLPTTEQEFTLLIDSLSDNDVKNRTAIFKRLYLAKAKGSYSPDAILLDLLKENTLQGQDKQNLVICIGKRGNEEAVKGLLQFALDNPDDPATRYALEAASKNASEDNFGSFISLLSETTDSSVNQAAERALKNIISNSRRKNTLADQLIGAFDASLDSNYKLTMTRLLGTTGSDKALKKLTNNLKSSQSQERIAAATAFADWPNDVPFNVLIDAYEEEDNGSVKDRIFKSATDLISADRLHDPNEVESYWITLSGYASTDAQKSKIITEAVQANQDWSLLILNSYLDPSHSKRIRDLSTRGIKKLKE